MRRGADLRPPLCRLSRARVQDNNEPDSDITLEWVHGFRCSDCRGTVLYTRPTRDIVFFTGSTAVVMTPRYRESHQRFYQEHTDEILSMAVHPIRPFVATGGV